jgi:CheY-like chemotaxis protein
MNANKKPVILIVDDEPDVVYVLKASLERKGYAIETANNGLVALEMVEKVKPDAIILDLMMPKLDGHSVNLKLKENPATAAIPVIVITGKGHLKELLEIRDDLKVAAYLEKPFRIPMLTDCLETILIGKAA